MLPSSANFLDKMMETMIMQLFNNQCKDSTPACNIRTCITKRDQKSRKRRNHRKHCKKKRSKCPTDIASIICVTKCMKKSKKPREKSKCPNPCSPRRKSRSVRMASCSSDSSASDPKYCSKCGQSLPGWTVSPKSSPDGPHLRHETHSKMYAKASPSPKETCITCHTQTTCTTCQNSDPNIRSQQNLVDQCVPECDLFGSPYFLGNLKNSKSKGLCGGYSRNNIGLTSVKKQKECLVQLTCCESKGHASSANKILCSPPPDVGNSYYPAAVRIKRCGKNIVTVRCGEDDDFDVSCMKTDNNVERNCKRIINNSNFRNEHCENDEQSRVEETQCSQRFIQITEDQRPDYGGNCVTKVRCADYSSITSFARPSSNRDCATEVPFMSSSSRRAPVSTNIGYSPCSDRGLSAVHPNSSPGHNMKSHVVRMKFVKPCLDSCCEIHGNSNIMKADMCSDPNDYESDCDEQPSCTCCVTNRPPILPFCYDPAIDHYENEFCDMPCHCLDEPLTTQYPSPCSQPPPPVYHQPYEYRPAQSPISQPSSASSDTEESLPPDEHYGYDFFYGTVRPPKHSGEKNSSNKSS